ncbi:glycosyltransferase family 39 protein [Lewinella sp. 4G2]|uniref:ArnT family glycosyltransferase n=1 Tax=Lewinella sp. 4G2 TaxID=1803372 RepID=UPI0007B4C9E2|nr:hypothetical protein [Lewinella sp. 4G2]OAV44359.1 hypothetical protein A3850_007560 [Lewinella sp. 4G2]
MPKKNRKKKPAPATVETSESAVGYSSRFQFFLWICSFFFFAALLIRTDVISPWPGAESLSLGHALSNLRGYSLLSFLYYQLFGYGSAIDASTQAVWLFPRLLSSVAVLLTAYFTYKYGSRLFGKSGIALGLLAAGASLFLPFFGKVATPDALALLGQTGFLLTVFLMGADKSRNYLLPAGIFLFVAGLAAPISTLVFGVATIVAARFILGGGKQWLSAMILVSLPLVILLLQGNQGVRSYWFWGSQPLAYLKFIGYVALGFLPLFGFFLAGVRDLFYKVARGEQAGRLFAAGLAISLLTQSLVFPLVLALLAGKQMQLYFNAPNYPWKDWVRGGAVIHLIFAFLGAFFVLLFGGISFPGAGFRAALGMVAAYWIFSLLGVIGLYGDKRDFALGGTLLAGLLSILFFWVQVYPYFETERQWAEQLVQKMEVKLPVYISPGEGTDVALPALLRAGVPVVQDSTEADFILRSWPISDSTTTADITTTGRVIISRHNYGLGR